MQKLFDWRFDAYRVKEHSKVVNGRNEEAIQSLVDDKLLEHELEIEDNESFLNIFIPLFGQDINQEARDIYRLFADTISLVSDGMGVGFRESLSGTLGLIEKNGFCPIILKDLVLEYEKLLYQEFDKNKKD